MDKYIRVKNCNCISDATIEIVEKSLNIKYGSNGTGKSTISEAIYAQANNETDRLKDFKPYGSNDNSQPTVDNPYFHVVKVFNEDYVNSYLFQGDEFLDDSFQVFLKSDKCDSLAAQIERMLEELQDLINNIDAIHNLRTFLPQYTAAVTASDGTVSRRGGVAEFVNGNGGGFNHYSELKAYKPFYSRDLPSVAKWAKWRNDGIKQMCGNDCPFCTNILPSSIRSQNEIISKVFKNSALSVANAVLEYVQQAVDQGYILPDAVDVLESYIGDNTKADELYAELQMLAKETDYLYKKIEKICMFKPMNVTHAQLVNLEQSLSELVIEERQLQSFYATDLIKKLIYHVSDKINALKGKTGQLKGLFLQHEKKLDELIAQRQDDINQFFTIAGFPYNFCLEKDGEKHAKAYLVPCEFQKEMVVDPKNRLSWGEKNAFSLVMFMFEAISDNADLIVLDDPISAFDEKKKFGIIRRLFDNKKDSFKEKTVLMLTHDFQPIIDYVHGNFFTRYGLITPVHASFIQNIEGSICESPITMNDLKNTVELTKDIVMSSNASMAVKIVNLRKYVELTKPEFGTSAIYEVLSNVIHGRQNPIYKDGQEISADVLEQGMREVSQYIPNKSYTDLINGTSTEILISSMSSDDLYHRIISIRLLFERVEGTLSLLRKKYPAACKFVNETNHVENDYIYQLDPRKYFGIPNYYLQQIENFIDECPLEAYQAIHDADVLKAIIEYEAIEIPSKFLAVEKIVRQIIEDGGKVVIWATFIHTIHSIKEYLESKGIQCQELYGAIPVEKEGTIDDGEEQILTREKIVRAFQDDNCPFKVIIANPFAVAESISLHKACHNAIYLERSFNAAHFVQSKDRIHRYGLKEGTKTNYYYILSEDSIDETIDARLAEKEHRMNEIMESMPIPLFDNASDDLGDEDIKALIKDYVRRTKKN